MINPIHANIQHRGRKNPLPAHNRQERLPLPTQPHKHLALLAAQPLRQHLVFGQDLQREERDVRVVRRARGPVRVLHQVAHQAEVFGDGRRIRLGLARRVDEREAEELVGVGEVVGGEEERGFVAGQRGEARLGFFGGECGSSGARVACEGAKADVRQRAAYAPAFGEVLLYSCVARAGELGGMPDAGNDLLDGGFVDKVVEAEAVGVLKLELVVVDEEAEEHEGREAVHVVFGVLNELHERGEEIAVREVGDESCRVGTRYHGKCHFDGLQSHSDCMPLVSALPVHYSANSTHHSAHS